MLHMHSCLLNSLILDWTTYNKGTNQCPLTEIIPSCRNHCQGYLRQTRTNFANYIFYVQKENILLLYDVTNWIWIPHSPKLPFFYFLSLICQLILSFSYKMVHFNKHKQHIPYLSNVKKEKCHHVLSAGFNTMTCPTIQTADFSPSPCILHANAGLTPSCQAFLSAGRLQQKAY